MNVVIIVGDFEVIFIGTGSSTMSVETGNAYGFVASGFDLLLLKLSAGVDVVDVADFARDIPVLVTAPVIDPCVDEVSSDNSPDNVCVLLVCMGKFCSAGGVKGASLIDEA